MSVARLLGLGGAGFARVRVPWEVEHGQMCGVHHTKEVDFEAFEIGRRRSCGIKTLWGLEGWCIVCNAGIRDDAIDATVGTQLLCRSEEIDLRLPLSYIAVKKVMVLTPSLLAHFVNQSLSSRFVDIADDYMCASICPFPEEAFSKSRSAAGYYDCLSSNPSYVVWFARVNRLRLPDDIDKVISILCHCACAGRIEGLRRDSGLGRGREVPGSVSLSLEYQFGYGNDTV